MIQLIFANYFCKASIEQSIVNLSRCKMISRVEICIVENGGEPVDLGRLPNNNFKSISTLKPEKNLGYFGALSAVWEWSKERHFNFRILCNPDIEFISLDFVQNLLAEQDLDNVAVLAPAIYSSRTGGNQNPYLRSPPNIWRRLWWRFQYASFLIYSIRSKFSFLRNNSGASEVSRGVPPSGQSIFAPHGSIMIFTPIFFNLSAEFKRVPFLYAEELFVGKIARDAGFRIRYSPELKVQHRENEVTSRLPSRERFDFQRAAISKFLRS